MPPMRSGRHSPGQAARALAACASRTAKSTSFV
jgi:hypothetical protein